jgi:cardiolipin synthase C
VLYEIKREGAIRHATKHRWKGRSRSSLHAKVFCVDRARVFIGSFNFDARSIWLNTEMGLVVDSAAFATPIAEAVVNEAFPAQAYAVRLDENRKLQWIEQAGDRRMVHDSEPHASLARRATVALLSLLPIDWLL